MKFISTRDSKVNVKGSEAIVKGLSNEGGLFVPESFPTVTASDIDAFTSMEYAERAAFIINKFVPEIGYESLLDSANKAYSKFDGEPAPVVKLDENLFVMELWHGPTHAFKDIALTLLPYLMTSSKKLIGASERTLILVATSGDTGKAALEGFKDVEGTDIIVLYPEEGVSDLQKLQMMTQKGNNVKVCAIKGNFDDAQTAVKKIFTDKEMAEKLLESGVKLSSANSINWGRLVPQITYYFSAYADLLASGEIEEGEEINFCVPSGNFGNILAGYYAKRMGLPVHKLICASNKNNVLTDFINRGEYDINREFYKTTSPSMDILISSNLERLIFELSGRDDAVTAQRMAELKTNKTYAITKEELENLKKDFYAGCVSENEVKETVSKYFDEYGYIADTHTSVGLHVYEQFVEKTDDEHKTVVLSTASPYKFVNDVLIAIGEKPEKDEMKALEKLENVTALPLPDSLKELPTLKKLHTGSVDKEEVPAVVLAYVKK